MKRSPIAPTSKKRAALLRKRKKLTEAMKEDGSVMCQFEWKTSTAFFEEMVVRCLRRADDLHEIVSRARGGSIVDPENVVPLCREHHRWVTEHPLEAAELGLLRRKQ